MALTLAFVSANLVSTVMSASVDSIVNFEDFKRMYNKEYASEEEVSWRNQVECKDYIIASLGCIE